ncbi:MAG: SDR family NAD(P)-dependent oxidoreductase, partial [Myxococcota bacterium]
MKNFEGKVAVVTGAASGIGRATALRLAARGCRIALADLDRGGLDSLVEELTQSGATASIHIVDVSASSQMEGFARDVEARYGAVDLLINNAGVAIAGTF